MTTENNNRQNSRSPAMGERLFCFYLQIIAALQQTFQLSDFNAGLAAQVLDPLAEALF